MMVVLAGVALVAGAIALAISLRSHHRSGLPAGAGPWSAALAAPYLPSPPHRKSPCGIVIGALVVLLLLTLALKIVKQYEQGVLFRLGRVIGTREAGLTVIIPFVDVLNRVSLRIVTMPIQSQGIITREEHDHLDYTDRLRREVIKVDDFEHDLARDARQEDPWQQSEAKKRIAAASM